MEALLVATVALLLGLAALGAITLHKVRRIHQMQFSIQLDLTAIRQEVETQYRQLEALAALNRLLRLEIPLPALRGWAGSPDFLLILAEHVLTAHPERILECSSGASTLTLARCLELVGSGHVFSLEHDPVYARRTRAALVRRSLDRWATVVDAPLTALDGSGSQPWYSTAALPDDAGPFDMLVIDGPPQSTAPLARRPALPMLWPRLVPDCVTFLDDADRPDEKTAVAGWLEQYPDLEASRLEAEKGCARISRRSGGAPTGREP